MNRVFMLLSSIVLSALIIQKLIGRKHIRSRADDESIPPVSNSAF